MADPTPEDLRALLALNDVDGEIRRLQKRLDALPEQQQLDQAIEDRARLDEQRGERSLERDQAHSRATKEDREVDQLRERLAAEQQRMYGGEISNARELQSMRAEIDSVQRRIEEHEDAELEAMEETEQLDAAIADLDERLTAADAQITELTTVRDEAAQTLMAEIAELQAASSRQREPLPDDLLARYDKAVERFGGGAVGRLDGDRCTVCGIQLSYADVNDLVEGPPLTECPSCQRLMVVEFG